MAWTGYTWNETLFPNPKGLLNWVHSKNIYICLNLHPAEGCATYEKGYKEFASFMNNSNNASIPFKLEDPKFAEGYFLYLHHPHEEIGVDVTVPNLIFILTFFFQTYSSFGGLIINKVKLVQSLN